MSHTRSLAHSADSKTGVYIGHEHPGVLFMMVLAIGTSRAVIADDAERNNIVRGILATLYVYFHSHAQHTDV